MIALMMHFFQAGLVFFWLAVFSSAAIADDCPEPGDPKSDPDQAYQAARCLLDIATIREDQIAAFDIVHQAAKAGSGDAMTLLGDLYDGGTFLDKDPSMASYWYLRGARAGAPLAQLKTGLRYILGQAQTQDVVRGYAWVLLAEQSGFAKAADIREKLDGRFSESERTDATALAETLIP